MFNCKRPGDPTNKTLERIEAPDRLAAVKAFLLRRKISQRPIEVLVWLDGEQPDREPVVVQR